MLGLRGLATIGRQFRSANRLMLLLVLADDVDEIAMITRYGCLLDAAASNKTKDECSPAVNAKVVGFLNHSGE